MNGTGQTLTPLPADVPVYYAYAALKDGRVVVGRGEYNVASRVDLPTAQIYVLELPTPLVGTTLATLSDVFCDKAFCADPTGHAALFSGKTGTWLSVRIFPPIRVKT